MPIFIYTARDDSGRAIHGRDFAETERIIKERIARRNLYVISIQEKKEPKFQLLFFKKKIKQESLVLFCKQLATMLKGGVPVIKAIDSISGELKDPVFKDTLTEINHHIKSGESFSNSLRKFPRLFSPLFIAMAEAGEKSGSLENMLDRLSSYLQARDRLNKKIIAALIYPTFIVIFFLGAITLFTLVLIPKFKAIYSGFKSELPLLTQIVFNISDLLIKNIAVIIIVIAVIAFFSHRYFFRTKRGKSMFDRATLKLPLFGDFLKNAALSKLTRTLAALLNHGIPIAQSIELVGRTSGNSVIEDASIKVKNLVLDGANIPEALKKAEIFPPLMIQMVSVGVESGNLPELLEKTADFYEDRVDNFVAVLTSMIEPIMLAVLGVIVGVVVIALYLPIFKLSQAIGSKA